MASKRQPDREGEALAEPQVDPTDPSDRADPTLPEDTSAAPAARQAAKPISPGHCRVYLSADSQRRSFVDPQTHLRVTKTPRDVPEELVGSGCELATDVIVERN